jgi:tetratricopeptide (TPR) repeat protein
LKRFLVCLPLFSTLTFSAPAVPTNVIDQRILTARNLIAKDKSKPQGYDELALALVRRARETADPKFCAEAEGAVAQSLKLDPNAFDGLKAHAVVRLCQQRWEEARDELAVVNKRVPDDMMTWGYLADSDIALGNYDQAQKSVQVMLNLRRVNPQGLQRGAELRRIFGFNDPALEWWNSALRLSSANDSEERAWIETHIAQLNRMVGRYDAADSAAKQALDLVPNYPWALAELGRDQFAQKKFIDSANSFQLLVKVAPAQTSALLEFGAALQAAGQADDANRSFIDFEKRARAEIDAPANFDLALIRYYAGPGKQPAEAQRIAKLSLQRRRDIETTEAYSQALAAGGDFKGASEQIARALNPGVKDPAWLLEAGRLAQKAGDTDAAHKYFQQGLEAAPASPLASEIIQALTVPSKNGP